MIVESVHKQKGVATGKWTDDNYLVIRYSLSI